ncbi:MAG: ABC transporter substrate-binding protein [Dehalococcoidia bacterium]|nr:ABC transporter substrate-binding protein [Dehalococcoidia bacterium]
MKSSAVTIYRSFLRVAIIAAALSLLLACGQAEAPTPTVAPAATATPTKAPAATATPTKAVVAAATPTPTIVGPVATPTPTLVATPTPAAPAAEKPRVGGTMDQVLEEDPVSFDFHLASSGTDRPYALGKLYNNLLVNYEDQTIECDLCSEWHLANNGKTMVFTLVPGVKFHSGQELTSEDVKYSLRMIMGDVDGLASQRAGILKQFVESIETPSKYEVRLNLFGPSAFVPKVLSVASASIVRAGTTRAELTLKGAPAGTGPYLLKGVIPGASWKFERNPSYHKTGKPYIDAINYTYTLDASTRVAAFLAHKSDFLIYVSMSPEQFRPALYKLRDDGKTAYRLTVRGQGLYNVWMSLVKPPFNNLKLRQAVNLAIDRQASCKVTQGDAQYCRAQLLVFYEGDGALGRPESQVWNVLPGWGTGAKKQQEIEQAKQLVIDAGYPQGLDNINQPTRAGVPYDEMLQQELGKIGIRSKLEFLGQDAYITRLYKFDYGITTYSYRMTTNDPVEVIGTYFVTGAARSSAGYSNPEVDKLFVQMSSELDAAKRVALFHQIEDIILFKDQGYAPIVGGLSEAFSWNRLQGLTMGMATHPSGNSGFDRGDLLWFKN